MPDVLPTDGVVMLVNPDKAPEEAVCASATG